MYESPLFKEIAKRHPTLPAGEVVKVIQKQIGISRTYAVSLRNGCRDWASLPTEKLRTLAKCNGIKSIRVLQLAGVINAEDLVVNIADQVEAVRDQIAADPKWGAYAPTEAQWDGYTLTEKALIAGLYKQRSFELPANPKRSKE